MLAKTKLPALDAIMAFKSVWALTLIDHDGKLRHATHYAVCLIGGSHPVWGVWTSRGTFLRCGPHAEHSCASMGHAPLSLRITAISCGKPRWRRGVLPTSIIFPSSCVEALSKRSIRARFLSERTHKLLTLPSQKLRLFLRRTTQRHKENT